MLEKQNVLAGYESAANEEPSTQTNKVHQVSGSLQNVRNYQDSFGIMSVI